MRRSEPRFLAALAGVMLWSTLLASTSAQSRPFVQEPTAALSRGEPEQDVLPSLASLSKQPLPDWVLDKPARETQTQKSVRDRGVNPCLTRDPGYGAYTRWSRAPSIGQMITPRQLELDEDGGFDVVFHFHGHEAARKEWVQALESGVLVGIDLGNGSGPYLKSMGTPGKFARLLESVEKAVAKEAGVAKATARRIALSAWSAGYGAVSAILRSRFGDRIDSVILMDGLHTGYRDSGMLGVDKLEPFAKFARRAATGERMMFVSHSSIIPPDYASTTETANYLIWQLGGQPNPANPRPDDPMGLELISQFSKKDFSVRGFAGNDALDHCAQIGLYQDVLREHLAPRWGLETREETDLRLAQR